MAEQVTQNQVTEVEQEVKKPVEVKPVQKPSKKSKDEKNPTLEREYIIPLRKAILRVPKYERAGKAIREIKKFIVKHMKVTNRDVNNVRIDPYFNNEVWFKGRTNPPTKVRVKATKTGDIVKVDFVEAPPYVAFLKTKHARRNMPVDKKKAPKPEEAKAKPEQKEGKTEQEKQEEKEKAKATAELHTKEAKQQAQAQKHTTKGKAPQIHRTALKK